VEREKVDAIDSGCVGSAEYRAMQGDHKRTVIKGYWRRRYRDPETGQILKTTSQLSEEAAMTLPEAEPIEGSMSSVQVDFDDFRETGPESIRLIRSDVAGLDTRRPTIAKLDQAPEIILPVRICDRHPHCSARGTNLALLSGGCCIGVREDSWRPVVTEPLDPARGISPGIVVLLQLETFLAKWHRTTPTERPVDNRGSGAR